MSTRANIKVTDEFGCEFWYYKHYDGDPEGTMPILNKFLDLVKSGKLRDNCNQACGWLIVLGTEEDGYEADYNKDWKVGAIEPTDRQHGDIEYLYTISLDKKTIIIEKV